MPVEPMGAVVVGVDGSLASMRALNPAAAEAVGRVAPMIIVYVRQRGMTTGDTLVLGRRVLAVAEARVAAEYPCLSVTTELATEEPSAALMARSNGASLIVVAAQDSGVGGRRDDSVEVRLANRSIVPVLVYRPLARGSLLVPRPVAVFVDLTDPVEAVLEFAFAEASMRGASLFAVSVDQSEESSELADTIEVWSSKHPDVAATAQIRRDNDVSEALREVSRDSQLIVIGQSRRDQPPARASNSVSETLVRRAGCPLVVVPRD